MKLGLFALMMSLVMPVMASDDYRTWTDQYGDVAITDCGDGTYVESVDPNRCGEAMANGASGCTEMAMFNVRSRAQSDVAGSVLLGTNNTLVVTGDQAVYSDFRGKKHDLVLNLNYSLQRTQYECSMNIR